MAHLSPGMARRTTLVVACAGLVVAALVVFQYVVVFLGVVGYNPQVEAPVTTGDRVSCFRAIVFVGPRYACSEGFVGGNSEIGAAALNMLGGVAAAAGVAAVGGVHRYRRVTSEHTAAFGAAVLSTLLILGWTLVSTFGLLLRPALPA